MQLPAQEFDSLSSANRQRRQYAHDLCRLFNRSPSKGNLKKLKKLFQTAGAGLIIEGGFHCDYGDRISIGDNVYININCSILDGGLITIGNDVLIGPNVQLLTINHPLEPQQRLEKKSLVKNITISNNVWVGAGAILLPGITVGENSVIAAGSVVSRDIQPNCLVAGNPAKLIKLV
jgi:maltose O-acetyltransferase